MLITIDTDILVENKIDAHQFLILKLIQEKEIDQLIRYLKENDKYNELPKDIEILISKGLLASFREEMYDFKNLSVTNEFIRLISGDDLFEELVQYYPRDVVRPDGNIDYLRTDLPKAKRIYTKLTQNNKSLHDHILRCLKEEIEYREDSDRMKFMKRLPKWISERGWESYKEQVRDLQSVNGNSNFGHGIE